MTLADVEFFIKSTPAKDYELHADPIRVYNDLMQVLYLRALAYNNGKHNTDVQDIRDLPREQLCDYFGHVEIASRIMILKGIEAFNMFDPALAERMFFDAIDCSPSDYARAEPYFYLAVMGIILQGAQQDIDEMAQKALRVDPSIGQRSEHLLDRLRPVPEAPFKESLKNYLTELAGK